MEIRTITKCEFSEKERFAIELVRDLIEDILIWEEDNLKKAISQISADDLEATVGVLEDMLRYTKGEN